MNATTTVLGRLSRLAFIAALMLATVAAGCAPEKDVPPLERRAQQINSAVMCPVCPGESIDQSQHPLAAQMRDIVAGNLEDGWTEAQIKDYFVDAYGPGVLLEPPTDAGGLGVWLVPPLALALALALLVLVLRRMSAADRPPAGAPGLAGLPEDERRRLLDRVNVALAYEGIDAPQEDTGAGPEPKGDASA